MSKLAEGINRLAEELELVVKSKHGQVAVESLQEARNELVPISKKVKKGLQQRIALSKSPVDDPPTKENFDEVHRVSELLGDLINQFEALDEKFRITQAPDFQTCRDALEDLASVGQYAEEKFKKWKKNIEQEVEVSLQDLETQKQDPSLQQNAKGYEDDFGHLKKMFAETVITESLIGRIADRRRKLLVKKQNMVFDQPKEVTNFLRRLKDNGSLPVSELTETVIAYFKDRNELAAFHVFDRRERDNKR